MTDTKKEIKNAVIADTFLGLSEENVLTAWLIMNFGVAKQGFGGLDLTKDNKAATFIANVLILVGVPEIKQLVGKAIRVQHDATKIYSIGNFIDDRWLNIDSLILSETPDGLADEKLSVIEAVVEEVPASPPEVDEEGKKHYGLDAEAGKLGSNLPKDEDAA